MLNRRQLPNKRRTETHKVKLGRNSVFVSIGYYDDDTAGEVFIDTAKAGTQMKELMEAVGKLVSLALQLGAGPDTIAGILEGATPGTIPQIVARLIEDEYIHPDNRGEERHQGYFTALRERRDKKINDVMTPRN